MARCKKGTRRCKYTKKCVSKVSQKRDTKCRRGHRQCANRVCYLSKPNITAKSLRSRKPRH